MLICGFCMLKFGWSSARSDLFDQPRNGDKDQPQRHAADQVIYLAPRITADPFVGEQ